MLLKPFVTSCNVYAWAVEIPHDSKHGRWAQLAEVAQTDVPDVAKGKLSISQRLEVESQETMRKKHVQNSQGSKLESQKLPQHSDDSDSCGQPCC